MMANGNLILNTLPDACTVMPRSRTIERILCGYGKSKTMNKIFTFLSSCVRERQSGRIRNLFLHPLLDIYKDISHSYIIELKYAKGKDSSERIEQLRRQAIEQAERYASSESVQKAIGPTDRKSVV